MLLEIANSSVLALDDLWTFADPEGGSQISVLDTIQDPAAVDPESEAQASEVKDRLADAIEALPERERLVIALYYYENLTLREIGEVLGVTESRVSQLHTKAVLGLRSRFTSVAMIDSGRCRTRPPTASATSRLSVTGAAARPASPRRSCSSPASSTASGGSRTARPSATSSPTSRRAEMSIGAAVTSFEHDGRKVNMIDTPGDPSFVADTLAALRVVDAAVFVVNGVMGVEVHTERLWRRADAEGLARLRVRQHARPRARRLLSLPRRRSRRPSASTWSRPRSRSAPSTRSAA